MMVFKIYWKLNRLRRLDIILAITERHWRRFWLSIAARISRRALILYLSAWKSIFKITLVFCKLYGEMFKSSTSVCIQILKLWSSNVSLDLICIYRWLSMICVNTFQTLPKIVDMIKWIGVDELINTTSKLRKVPQYIQSCSFWAYPCR